MKIQYAVLDNDPDAETKFDVRSVGYPEKKTAWIAEECAEDYVQRHAGIWPDEGSKTFAMFDEEGKPLGVYDVTMEMTPIYQAVRKEE